MEKRATCLATMLENEFKNRNFARFKPPMFKPVNNLICCKTGLMWVVKCSYVARQVARILLPVFPYLTSTVKAGEEYPQDSINESII